jgi:ABC-2 type transport system permease protein
MLNLDISFYISAFIGYLFMPILPTILGGVFGYIIGYFASKVNNNKIFETVLTYVAVLLIMFVSFNIQSLAMKFINNVEVVNNVLSNIGFVINSFMKMVTENSIKDLLIYVFTNILSALIFVAIFTKTYIKIMQNLKVEKAKDKYIEKEHNSKGVITTLLIKELKMYLSIPIYILNTSFGVVLILFASIATLFYDKNALFKIMEVQPDAFPIYVLLLAGVAFLVAMSNTAACSISIEGKNFWILKTMPIKTKDILLSKLLLNILVVVPLCIISIILLGISFEITVSQILIVCLMAVVINLACSMFGLIVNLKYPRLDFQSYTHVVKQSLSTFLAIMVPLAVFFGFVILYSVLKMSIDTYILIAFALLLAIIVVEYYILKKWGIKKFNDIN